MAYTQQAGYQPAPPYYPNQQQYHPYGPPQPAPAPMMATQQSSNVVVVQQPSAPVCSVCVCM